MIWIFLGLLALGAIVLVVRQINSNNESKAVLRHTIEVNLGILKSERKRLTPLVPRLNDTDRAESERQFAENDAVVARIEPRIPVAGRNELGSILSQVFACMDRSITVVRLVNQAGLVEFGPNHHLPE